MKQLLSILLMALSFGATAQKKLSQLPIVTPDTGMSVIVVNKVGTAVNDVRVRIDNFGSYVGGLVDLQHVTTVGSRTNVPIVIKSGADSTTLTPTGLKIYNEVGGSASLIAHDTSISTVAVVPAKNRTLSWELTTRVKTDASFGAKLDEMYILPQLTANRNITMTDVPRDGDRISFVNQNLSGFAWNLVGWSFVDYAGAVTVINNVGAYHLKYVAASGRWVRY